MSRSSRLATILLAAISAACTATASSTAPPSAAALAAERLTVSPAASATSAPTPTRTTATTSTTPSPIPGALGGALPAALWGTWQLKGTTGHWVFTADRASSYSEDGSTELGAGASGNELSLGPRLDDPTACQKIGLYRWKLVSATELTLTPIKQDPCPRGQALLHADFVFSSPSTAPLS